MDSSGDLNYRSAISDLQKKIQSKRSDLKRLEDEIDENEKMAKIFLEKKNKLENENQELSFTLAGNKATIASLEKQRDEEMNVHSKTIRQLQNCKDKEDKIKLKKQQEMLKRFRNKGDFYKKAAHEIGTHLALKKGENVQVQSNKDPEVRAKKENELATLKSKIEGDKKKVAELEAKIKENKAKISKQRNAKTMESVLKERQKQGMDLEEQIQRLRAQIRGLERDDLNDSGLETTRHDESRWLNQIMSLILLKIEMPKKGAVNLINL